MRGNYLEFLNLAGREDEIREPAACAGLLFVTARSFSWVFFWFFYETLPYPLQKSSTVNLHIRVLYAFFAFFGSGPLLMKKMPVLPAGENQVFPVEIRSGWKTSPPLTLEYCSNLCGDIPISDLRRMSILRKPLFI